MEIGGVIAILAVLAIISILAIGLFIWQISKLVDKDCTEGPAFWCQNKANWDLCKKSNDGTTYHDYCCKSNKDYINKLNIQDQDPSTNGYNANCVNQK
jgi:hypothetical protein